MCLALPARLWAAHTVYLANDNHTDYGWNASTDAYDASMLSELDYYLAQIAATAGNPPDEQARFNADGWWYLYLYEHNRTPAQFAALIDAMHAGHVTVPLNPLVDLYGALPTEAAIRAGYYPGRMARQYGLTFPIGLAMEDATIPWGLASIWAGSGAKYTWKGICGCATPAPFADRDDEVFRWQGPDDKTLLMKWYQIESSSSSWGGYAEARDNLSIDGVQSAIERFSARPPFLDVVGLFGAGWNDVNYETDAVVNLAHDWNATRAPERAVVSNEVDYFQALEPRAADLPVLRGGWGNDWDLWPAALSARTSQTRQAVERLRTAEALGAVVEWQRPGYWSPYHAALDAAWVDYFKYFEHTWGDGGAGLQSVIADKRMWAQHFDDVTAASERNAAAAFGALLATPDEDRFVVFNPLGFERTDYADVEVGQRGPFIVTDVASGSSVPSQIATIGGNLVLRVLARGVPPVGYRVYRYSAGTPPVQPVAAVIDGTTIESDRYRVTLGERGEIMSALDKDAGRELAGEPLNDFGSGSVHSVSGENIGPVSASLRVQIGGIPSRVVEVTLIRDVDRIEIDDQIVEAYSAEGAYRFPLNLAAPAIHFEEVGALARPGGPGVGDFLPGTRADFMTLNHFVDFALDDYHVTVSNWDAFAMRIGTSTAQTFDAAPTAVSVLATGNPSFSQIAGQGGDAVFRNRFALRGAAEPYSGSAAMRASLAHQNPLRGVPLERNQAGTLTAPTASFVSTDHANLVVTAVKPAEEADRGIVVRLWELDGADTTGALDVSLLAPTDAMAVSLVETDQQPAALSGGVIQVALGANEMRTFRVVPATLAPTATPSATGTAGVPPTRTATPIRTPTPTRTITATPPGTFMATPTATLVSPRGDVNGDLRVDGADVSALIAAIFGGPRPAAADVNHDQRVSVADIPGVAIVLGSAGAQAL